MSVSHNQRVSLSVAIEIAMSSQAEHNKCADKLCFCFIRASLITRSLQEEVKDIVRAVSEMKTLTLSLKDGCPRQT